MSDEVKSSDEIELEAIEKAIRQSLALRDRENAN